MPAERKPCRSCREPYAVNRDGRVRMHGFQMTPEGLWDGCPGARRPPLGEPDPDGIPDDSPTYRDERDALMRLIVQPWDRDGDGVIRYKVNLAWWDTADTMEEAVKMVREAAKLGPLPEVAHAAR